MSLFDAVSQKCKEVGLRKKALGSEHVDGEEAGERALVEAVVNGDERKVERVLLAGIDADLTVGGEPILHIAAADGFVKVVQSLIRLGATVDQRCADNKNRTALHAAAVHNHEVVVAQLVLSGAEVDARDTNGQTPLHLAASRSYKPLCNYLISKGASIRVADVFNYTPTELMLESLQHPAVETTITRTAVSATHLRDLFFHHSQGKDRLSKDKFVEILSEIDHMSLPCRPPVWQDNVETIGLQEFAIEALKVAQW